MPEAEPPAPLPEPVVEAPSAENARLSLVWLVPLAAACGSEKADGTGSGSVGADGARVTGVRWSIDSVTVDGTTHRAPDAAHVRIDDGGEAAGSTG